MLESGILKDLDGLKFPSKKLGIGSDTLDPNSPYVRQRKCELEAWLRRLFAQNLHLFKVPRVVRYFQVPQLFYDLLQHIFLLLIYVSSFMFHFHV